MENNQQRKPLQQQIQQKNKKKNWRSITLTEENIDEYINDLASRQKVSNNITKGVSFNKNDIDQMDLLKKALLVHHSFSGLVKHLLYDYFNKMEEQEENSHESFKTFKTPHEASDAFDEEPPPISQEKKNNQKSISINNYKKNPNMDLFLTPNQAQKKPSE